MIYTVKLELECSKVSGPLHYQHNQGLIGDYDLIQTRLDMPNVNLSIFAMVFCAPNIYTQT